jgi:hypothetical protein
MVLTLMSYKLASFDQGQLLKAKFPLKNVAQEGVCYALTIEFYRELKKGRSPTAQQLVAHLDSTLGTSVSRQAMHDDGLAEFRRAGGGVYDFLTLFNAMGRVSGVTWTFGGQAGATAGQFATAGYMLRVEFASGGGHAIAVLKIGNTITLFDPNFGIFRANGATGLSAGLFAQYVSLGMVVSRWWLLKMVDSGGVGIGAIAKA